MKKSDIQRLALIGGFIPYDEFCNYPRTSRLDGVQVKNFLEDKGFIVTDHGGKPRNEYARTACGLEMSSNGYIHTTKGADKNER